MQFNMFTDAEFFMKKLSLESGELIRRFLISSAFKSSRVVIISQNLAFKRVAYYPYTHGEEPWVAICDLARFADTVVVTSDQNTKLIYRLAECSHRYDHRLRLYLSSNLPLILISDKEAIKDGFLVSAQEKEYREILKEAEAIIRASKQVDYGMYLELDFLCRTQC